MTGYENLICNPLRFTEIASSWDPDMAVPQQMSYSVRCKTQICSTASCFPLTVSGYPLIRDSHSWGADSVHAMKLSIFFGYTHLAEALKLAIS